MAKKRGRAKERRSVAEQIEDYKKRDADQVTLQRLTPTTFTDPVPPVSALASQSPALPAFDPDRPSPGSGNHATSPEPVTDAHVAPVLACKARCGPGFKRVCGKPVEDGRYCKRHELTSRIKKAISRKATAQNIVAALVAAEAGFGAEAKSEAALKVLVAELSAH